MLGGGGLVGMAYHAGALQALHEAGVDAGGFDLVVGTSAGAIIGSYLRAGWTATDFYDYAHGRHPNATRTPEEQHSEVDELFRPLWSNAQERARRSVGSMFAAAASRGYWRAGSKGHVPRAPLRRLFPAGLYSTERTRERFHQDLPSEWPELPLLVCAADLYSGRRVAFGAADEPRPALPDAVLASTAIPGVFPPVRIKDRQYVDGGVKSATSLDLAVDDGCRVILCVAPLGYRTDAPMALPEPKLWGPMFVRSLFARALKREVQRARTKGIDVFVVRPWLSDLAAHGTNSMRRIDRAAIAEGAREGTLRLIEANRDHPALSKLLRSSPAMEA